MESPPSSRGARSAWPLPPLDARVLFVLVAAKLALHLATAGRYGYFRDELYFLDCARHLDWGYVDCAPLIAVYAKVALLLGGSLPVLRTIAAIAGAARVALTMLLAREMGGGRFAQAVAGLCVISAGIFLGEDSILTMNGFESLYWMGCVFFAIRIVRTGNSRLWVWFGLLAGLGIENKHSTLFFLAAFAAGLLLSPERRELARSWIWIGAAIALLLFLPNVLWQIAHGFPTIEDLRNVQRSGKNVVLSPLQFLGQQILLLHPLLLPFWVGGLYSLFFGRALRLRLLGWTYVFLLAVMIVLKAKNYYLAPIYPMLFASGALALESWLERRGWSRGRAWPKIAIGAYIAGAGAMAAPAILPILSPENLLAYQRAIGAAPPKTEVRHEGPLEQRLGDQFGWPELVADVTRIYRSLPEAEQAKTGIFASNYGEAGALHLFGPAYGLPDAICAHQNHYFWGPPKAEPENLIWLQWGRRGVEDHCRSVEKAGEHFHPWGMAEENRAIWLCRGLKHTIAEYWTPDFKHWN
ncbi:MAG TPA: glycosyltransferase family 39 protein [Thermoanaerobaculia bacterium]|nr:glycosyltransferase family 39 protein [Thermoanaerobaculia bacterium]